MNQPRVRGKSLQIAPAVAILIATGVTAGAGELGHYTPGMPNIRDFFVPEPGVYFFQYHYFYTTDTFRDEDGHSVDSITINPGPGPGVTLDLEVDVDVFAVAPTLAWVSPWEVFGARYAAYFTPSLGNPSVSAALTTQTGLGLGVDESEWGLGDLYVEPLWLGWPLEHWDFEVGYGVYAPVGKYDVDSRTFPALGITVESPSPDNVGLGFWTHQFQGGVAWYPWEHRGTAVVNALTYEIHHEKEDLDITPGSHLTWNWGISQYLPLTKDNDLILEVGPTGYSQWQVTDDSGGDALNEDVHDQVHAAGGQLGLTYVPWNAFVNAHYVCEFGAEDRFEGQAVVVAAGLKF